MKNLGFKVRHIGLNMQDEPEAKKTADLLLDLFGFEESETPISIFSSPEIEVMKKKGAGRLGHIAIETTDIGEARNYLASKGIEFDENSAAYFDGGKLKLIYLKNDIAGFAFHLVQK
ncbi:VOC family protein [Caproiciproducens sp. NJN-50]|uniref:VOC family protein n=1 Tax=Acutalibacteraceae TaxID=3082771 RepID=UPI000FFDFC72|nr:MULTISPECIES: VOC family protein [Acutalibacteraceae]QAT50489.1 VOC family protein [Caproiciproducens sp. NJN-50]